MNKEERHQSIVNLIEQSGDRVLSTGHLAQHFNVSEMTIRRDLQDLAEAGLIQRQHGGATSPRRSTVTTPHQGEVGIFLVSREDKYADPFFNEVLQGADRKLKELGYRTAFVYTYADVNTIEQTRELLRSHNVDGVLLIGTHHTQSVEHLKQVAPVLVATNGSLGPEYDAILIDGYTSIRQLVGNLAKRGKRRVAFITGHYDSRERGFIEGVKENNLPDEAKLRVTLEYGFEGWIPQLGERGAEILMKQKNPPDAIICASDRLAIGAMQWLHQNGFHVPDDIAVTGFDNIANSQFTIPPLTTVHVHKELIGALAAERAVRRIENKDEIPLQIWTPTSVIIRQSCGSNPMT
jgi:DNA-binding LacI/PurR family transcriptional regulator